MELYIYDKWLNELGIVDIFKSLIWTPRFYTVGSFELKAPMTDNNVRLLQKNRYIHREDVGETGFIESIFESHDEDGDFIIVSGSMLEGMLDKRTLEVSGLSTKYLNTKMAELEYESYNVNCFEKFYFDAGDGSVDYLLVNDATGQNWGEYCRNLMRADERVFKIRLYPSGAWYDRKIVCSYYKGTDRSTEQSENPHVIFSTKYGNMYNTVYNYSEKGCYNDVTVVADLRGVNYTQTTGTEYPLYVSKNNGQTGLAKTRLVIRQKPVINTETQTIYGVPVTVYTLDYDATKEEQLKTLDQYYCEYTENFEGTAIGDGYRTEWQLGDYVTVEDDRRGTSYKKQIEEVSEVFENGVKTVTVVFGENLKTIIDLVKEAKK